MRYRLFDHTSDLGVEIFGRDLPELFANAAYAVFDNITDMRKVAGSEKRVAKVEGENVDELLLNWLRELLFLFATEFYLTREVAVITMDEKRIEAVLRGERFDSARHRIKIEIKTPTYHQFSLKKTGEGWTARIIFDV